MKLKLAQKKKADFLRTTNYVLRTGSGFTLLEILLVLAAVGVIAAIGAPLYQPFSLTNDLDIAQSVVARSFRRAETLAVGVTDDSPWGVEILTGSITIFEGTSYVARVPDKDEIFSIPTSITPSGLSEVVFAKMTAAPMATGAVVLTTPRGEVRTITINAKGMISQ